MTRPIMHLWRLRRWARILARHGALRGLERDPNTPVRVRQLIKFFHIGVRVPRTPRYADAFQAIGPAAIKLGQALATRPDLVGEDAAHDLARLQDAVPPVPFAAIRQAIEQSLEKPIDQIFASIEMMRRQGRALLIVEQYVDRALDIADYVYILHKGQVVFVGEPEQCRDRHLFDRYLGSVA